MQRPTGSVERPIQRVTSTQGEGGATPRPLLRFTPFLGYGSITTSQVYVPGSRSVAVSEKSPLASVVTVSLTPLPVMAKSTPACGWSPAPSAACLRVFVISMAPRFLWLVYVQSRTSLSESMSKVTVAPLICGVTPLLAEQSTLTNSQSAG